MKLLAIILCSSLLSISAAQIHPNVTDRARRCESILRQQICTNGFGQALADVALRCGIQPIATSFENGCRRNSNGLLCRVATTYTYEVENIETVCETSVTDNCTSECRDSLMMIRDEVGCCINLIFNTTTSNREAFNNTLWTNCGVEPVTETCSSSTIIIRQIDVDPDCDFSRDGPEIGCTSRFMQPIFDELEEEGDCQSHIDGVMERCGVRETGERCPTRSDLTGPLTQTIEACTPNNSTCTIECSEALEDFSNEGCCINNALNGSLAGITVQSYSILSYEFWSNCGVETVGNCEIRINGAAYLKAGTIVVMLMTYLSTFYF